MSIIDTEKFHWIYGSKRTRMTYQKKDFVDYTIMTIISMGIVLLVYGASHPLSLLGMFLGVLLIALFVVRHEASLSVPLIIKMPHELIYLFVYKFKNIKVMYLVAVGIFVIEKVFISFTPGLPHNTELMRKIAIYSFYIHFVGIIVYRTIILISHLKHRELVKEVLLLTTWKGIFKRQPNIAVHIVHAYATGIFTHIVFIAPWFFVINYFDFSLLLAPLICVLNVIVHVKYMKTYNAWFYRDHWLGHNSEMDFLYLHGTHHDAIPSGLIGVSGNGHLEGFLRHTLGNPMPLYNPFMSFMLYTLEVQQDIQYHQYIPGVFPSLSREFHEHSQHSTHHFGMLEPYSIGFKNAKFGKSSNPNSNFPPKEILNSIELDEQLNGFEWNNKRYQLFLEIFDRYQKQKTNQ